jgi:8-oxo-dGTP diphosphatase
VLNSIRLCVAAIVTDGAGHVLLVQTNKRGPRWELPGGGVDPDETWQDALRREVVEETDVDGLTEPRVVAVLHGTPKPGAEYRSLIVVGHARGRGEPRRGGDAPQAKWWPIDELPELADLATSKTLREWCISSYLVLDE